MNLPILALLADENHGYELPMPAEWFGVIMFILLMLALLVTLGFANKGKKLPADPNSDH
ncbi:hypothetical protein [Nesterenkonia flava]|uniref:Uncharacterized protein n=1 Tax=Nesterenkonia flava TaxID=469799 RepID=A0ABU1FRN4_9MICC|nr:hypothetical protein [Nesterenkonia flava]MDR5711316.1 hypothetical protein [Nesterenkonia flava]